MKLSISTEELAEALGKVRSICASKSTLPILGSVLLQADAEGRLKLTGNNLDYALEVTLSAQVEKAGECAVSGDRLTKAVAQMDAASAELRLEMKAKYLFCEAGAQQLSLRYLEAKEFPPSGEMGKGTLAMIFAPGTVGAMLSRLLLFVCDDATRFVLYGVNLEGAGGKLRMTATDGRRLMTTQASASNYDVDDKVAVIMPRGMAGLIAQMDDGGDAEGLEICCAASLIEASGAGWRLIGKAIEGTFPNYAQVIPKVGERSIETARRPFLAALPFINAVMETKSSTVRLEAVEKNLTLRVATADVGEASQRMEAVTVGAVPAMGFNGEYLRDALRALSGERVKLTMSGDEPGPVRMDEEETTIVLMPMALK